MKFTCAIRSIGSLPEAEPEAEQEEEERGRFPHGKRNSKAKAPKAASPAQKKSQSELTRKQAGS